MAFVCSWPDFTGDLQGLILADFYLMEKLLALVWGGELTHSLKISLCFMSLYCVGVLGSGQYSRGISIAHCYWNNLKSNLTAVALHCLGWTAFLWRAKPGCSESFLWAFKVANERNWSSLLYVYREAEVFALVLKCLYSVQRLPARARVSGVCFVA